MLESVSVVHYYHVHASLYSVSCNCDIHCATRPGSLQGKPYDGKTDVWAIGCVLYEMCALKKAFDASNLGAITVKVMRYPFCSLTL